MITGIIPCMLSFTFSLLSFVGAILVQRRLSNDSLTHNSWCFRFNYRSSKKKNLEKNLETKTITYFFYKNSLDFLLPFSIVSFIFMVLSILFSYLDIDVMKLQALITLEQRIEAFENAVDFVKLSAGQSLLFLLAIFLVSFLRLPVRSISTKSTETALKRITNFLLSVFDKYQTSVKYIVIVSTLAASFTFFGRVAGEPSKNIAVKIKIAQQGYAENRAELRQAVESEILNETYQNIESGLKNNYGKLLNYADSLRKSAFVVGKDYTNKSAKYRYKSKSLERQLESFSKETRSIERLGQVSEETAKREHSENMKKAKSKISELSEEYKKNLSKGQGVKPERNLTQVSIETNKRLSIRIKAAAQKLAQKAPPVLFNQAGKKLPTAALKFLMAYTTVPGLSTMTQNLPLIGPLVDVFTDVLQDKFTAESDRITDKLMAEAMAKERFALDQEIGTEAKAFTRRLNLKICMQ